MKQASIVSLSSYRSGKRFWKESKALGEAGFSPGKRFTVKVAPDRTMWTIELSDSGDRIVSQKQRGGSVTPIIDIANCRLMEIFEGLDRVRVVLTRDKIFVLPLATDLQKRERAERLRERVNSGKPIRCGDLSHGIGVLSLAVHEGMKQAGVTPELSFANEIRDDLMEFAAENNPAWTPETQAVVMPMQEVAADRYMLQQLGTVEILKAGIPCSGHSVAGRAKRKLTLPECHPDVGHLAVAFLQIVCAVQPAIALVENVESYLDSASGWLIRNTLRDWGYRVHDRMLDSGDWNELEHRTRMCLIAVSDGIDFDFDELEKPTKVERRLSEIMEDVALDSDCWSPMEGLKAKEVRDVAAGKGFRLNVVDGSATSSGTIGKGYMKNRSTEPKFAHPENPDLLRLFTPIEHSRVKGTPELLIQGMSATLAHEALGQSVCFAPFVAVGRLIGRSIMTFAAQEKVEYSRGEHRHAA